MSQGTVKNNDIVSLEDDEKSEIDSKEKCITIEGKSLTKGSKIELDQQAWQTDSESEIDIEKEFDKEKYLTSKDFTDQCFGLCLQ